MLQSTHFFFFLSDPDFNPLPILQNANSNTGCKAIESQLITSSPYLQSLRESSKQQAGTKPARKQLQFGAPKKKNVDAKKKAPVKQKASAKKKVLKKDLAPAARRLRKPASPVSSDESSDESEDLVAFIDSDDELNFEEQGREDPNDDEAACLFCDGHFKNSRRGEQWIQCQECRLWAHLDCTDAEKDHYICDFCS